MEIIKSDNGFPYAWKAGRVEQLICSILENKAKQQLSCKRVMFINPTWLHEDDIAKRIEDQDPDFIICNNFVDPAVPRIFRTIENCGRPYLILGNADQFRLDFWAMVCDLYFQNYEEYNVPVLDTARKFICLNRKPHPHRVALVQALISAGLKDQGYLSLGLPGDLAITIDETFDVKQGIHDEYGQLGADETWVSHKIRNDIFSLGSDNVWQNSLLCLVTETEFNNVYPKNFFTSEKTFKPIIGMRPFFVYGQAPMREYLKQQGFDVFDDVFDYSIVKDHSNDHDRQQQYAQVAINAITSVRNPVKDYHIKYFGRCQYNKNHFRTYVYNQWKRLYDLDLTDYV
jgi:hypothetical protein